jgi:hypothetical protein
MGLMPFLPEKINRSTDAKDNAGFKHLAKAMVSGVKNSIRESPFLALSASNLKPTFINLHTSTRDASLRCCAPLRRNRAGVISRDRLEYPLRRDGHHRFKSIWPSDWLCDIPPPPSHTPTVPQKTDGYKAWTNRRPATACAVRGSCPRSRGGCRTESRFRLGGCCASM